MAIQFSCKDCGKAYRVADEFAGRKLACKGCGVGLVVPRPPSSRAVANDLYGLDDDDAGPASPPAGAYLPRGQARGRDGDGGPNWGLLAGLGAGALVLLLVGALVLTSGGGGGAKKPPAAGPETADAAVDAGASSSSSAVAGVPTPPSGSRAKGQGRPDARFSAGGASAAPATTAWRVEVDPAPGDLARPLTDGPEQVLPIPASYSGDFIRFPSTPSPFVLVGGNDAAEQKRVVYDLRTGKALGALGGRLDINNPMALSPDGRFLVAQAFTQPRKTVIWSVTDARQVGAIAEDAAAGPPQVVDFVGPNSVLITAPYYKRIEIWDFQTGAKVRDLPTADGWSWEKDAFAMSPGRRYAALGYDAQHCVRVYNLTTGALDGQIDLPTDGPNNPDIAGLAFSPDGTSLAALARVGDAQRILAWDTKTGEAQHDHAFPGKDAFGGTVTHDGPRLQWLPDGAGWLVLDQAIVERKTGQIVWSMPFDALASMIKNGGGRENAPRRIVGPGRAAVVEKRKNARVLRLASLPVETLRAAFAAAQGGGSALDALLPPLTATDLATAKRVSLPAGDVPWSVTQKDVAPAASAPSRSSSGRAVPLRVTSLEAIQLLLPGPPGTHAMMLSGPGGRSEALSHGAAQESRQVDRVDLAAGRVSNRFQVPAVYLLAGISPDGSRVLAWPGRDRDRVDVFDAATGKPVRGWRPAPRAEGGSGGPVLSWAEFLDADRVLTASTAGQVTLWSVPDAKPVYTIENVTGRPALSPSRTTLVLFTESAAWFVDAATGAPKGKIALSAAGGPSRLVAFRPDGLEVAAVLGDQLARLDLKEGKVVNEQPVPLRKTWLLQYAGPAHLLFNGQALLDLERSRIVWNFPGGLPGEGSPDGLVYHATARDLIGPLSLSGRALPGKTVTDTVAEAFQPSTKPLLAPGGQVAIQVDGAPPRDAERFREQVIAEATRWLGEQGVQVDPQAPSRIVVKFSERDTGSTIELQRIGASGQEKRQIAGREVITELSVLDRKGPPITLARRVLGPSFFGMTRIGPNDNDWEGAIRIQQWEEASRQLLTGGLPFLAARRAGGNGSLVLPGLTALGQPEYVPLLDPTGP
jgi:WD40 repeat protein